MDGDSRTDGKRNVRQNPSFRCTSRKEEETRVWMTELLIDKPLVLPLPLLSGAFLLYLGKPCAWEHVAIQSRQSRPAELSVLVAGRELQRQGHQIMCWKLMAPRSSLVLLLAQRLHDSILFLDPLLLVHSPLASVGILTHVFCFFDSRHLV